MNLRDQFSGPLLAGDLYFGGLWWGVYPRKYWHFPLPRPRFLSFFSGIGLGVLSIILLLKNSLTKRGDKKLET